MDFAPHETRPDRNSRAVYVSGQSTETIQAPTTRHMYMRSRNSRRGTGLDDWEHRRVPIMSVHVSIHVSGFNEPGRFICEARPVPWERRAPPGSCVAIATAMPWRERKRPRAEKSQEARRGRRRGGTRSARIAVPPSGGNRAHTPPIMASRARHPSMAPRRCCLLVYDPSLLLLPSASAAPTAKPAVTSGVLGEWRREPWKGGQAQTAAKIMLSNTGAAAVKSAARHGHPASSSCIADKVFGGEDFELLLEHFFLEGVFFYQKRKEVM